MKNKLILNISVSAILFCACAALTSCGGGSDEAATSESATSNYDHNPHVWVAEWGVNLSHKGFVVKGFEDLKGFEGFGRLVICSAPDSAVKVVCREAYGGEPLVAGDPVEFAAVSWLPVYSGTRCNAIIVRKKKS